MAWPPDAFPTNGGTHAQAEAWAADVEAEVGAIRTGVMVVVNHGSNASTARPSYAAAVYWIGTVEPTNALDDDLWSGA